MISWLLARLLKAFSAAAIVEHSSAYSLSNKSFDLLMFIFLPYCTCYISVIGFDTISVFTSPYKFYIKRIAILGLVTVEQLKLKNHPTVHHFLSMNLVRYDCLLVNWAQVQVCCQPSVALGTFRRRASLCHSSSPVNTNALQKCPPL